jgi:hypothetical protein
VAAQMTWHAEIIMLTLRRYRPGEAYEPRDLFASAATAHILGDSGAYVCGLPNDCTRGAINRADWLDLRHRLCDQCGIEHVESERHGERKSFDTGLAPLP